MQGYIRIFTDISGCTRYEDLQNCKNSSMHLCESGRPKCKVLGGVEGSLKKYVLYWCMPLVKDVWQQSTIFLAVFTFFIYKYSPTRAWILRGCRVDCIVSH